MFNLNTELLSDALYVFLWIIIEAFPFILIWVVASSLIHIYLKKDLIIKYLPKNKFLSLLTWPLIWFIFPVCECGNIPLARRMAIMKLPPSMVLSFLFSAPIINPIVIASTLIAFNYDIWFVLLRVGFWVWIALVISYFFWKVSEKELYSEAIFSSNAVNCSTTEVCCSDNQGKQSKGFKFFSNVVNEFIEMWWILIFWAFIASFLQAMFSRDAIVSLWEWAVFSILSMEALAIVTSICSNVDAFFALAYSNNFTTWSLLAFLVLWPMIDIKAFFMLRKIYKTKVIAFISLLIAMMTFLLCLIYNYHFL